MGEQEHLNLMRLLEQHPELSQRDLARAAGISLGKVNYCLKALVEKGWVKTQNFRQSNNKLAYAYILTPAGIKRKAEITVKFLQRKQREYKELEKEIERLRSEVEDMRGAAQDERRKMKDER